MRRTVIGGGLLAGALAALGLSRGEDARAAKRFPLMLTDTEWRGRLSPAAYHVLRRHGTERSGSSPLDREKRAGTFACAGCGQKLFASATKFDSRTGWPSFWQPLPGAIGTAVDRKLVFARTEVHCARCGGHLGHVFADGPKPTGKRYCMNGVAMRFTPARASARTARPPRGTSG